MKNRIRITPGTAGTLAVLAACSLLLPMPLAAQSAVISTTDMEAFHPRSVGPAVTGGRVHDVEAVPDNPSILWVASASGGLWKSTNRGQTWTHVFDTMAVSTFGDVALAPSNPDIVYAGTGEQNNRQSTSWGHGVYRTDDGGVTWRYLGLEKTRHIGKIEIDPTDPDVAYVAALGNLWRASPDRGVYRTTDGGTSWRKVLYVDENTGAVDLVMDPRNPGTMYAATYQRRRRTWGFNGGGPGSGIYRTTDGGEHWTELTNGIPEGDKGRIGLAIGRTDPRVLYALIQHADPERQGTYRSEDGGEHWTRVNELDPRPMYYSEIFVDPSNEHRVYVLGTSSFRSEDGGETFEEIAKRPTYDVGVHADHHALWIDPHDPDHLYLAGDAGLHESYDRGLNFRKINNFPIGQFYAIAVDMRRPYWIYGGLQDNHSFMGPSRTRRWAGILNDDWMEDGFGDGMYWQVDTAGGRFAYGSSNDGNYFRYDIPTGDMLDITPRPPLGEERYRFDWTSPSLLSRHDPNTLYVAGNRLFISRDRGLSWERTEDLSKRTDRDTLSLMGVRGADITLSRNDGTGSYGETTTLDESPVDARVLWVGLDDGNLQVSRDGGHRWTEVSGHVPGLPPGTYVSRITASARGPGVAYAAFDAHRDGDFAPYVYRTDDFGHTWTSLSAGLTEGSVNDVIEHPDNPDVLFLGTEHAMFASTDAGAHWAKMPNLPTTAYDDILIHPREKDLVMGTHGRAIWILDDTRPFAEWSEASGPAHLFSIAPATMLVYRKDTSYRGQADFAGRNPVDGAIITYRLGPGEGDAVLRVTGEDGAVVREMRVLSDAGTHRINWDLRHAVPGREDVWAPHDNPALARPIGPRGPWVVPGRYLVTLEARGSRSTQPVDVLPDPDLGLTIAQYRERERFALGVQALSRDLTEVTRRVAAALKDAPADRRSALEAARGHLRSWSFMVRRVSGALNGGGVRPGSQYPPTETQRAAIEEVRGALAQLRATLDMKRREPPGVPQRRPLRVLISTAPKRPPSP